MEETSKEQGEIKQEQRQQERERERERRKPTRDPPPITAVVSDQANSESFNLNSNSLLVLALSCFQDLEHKSKADLGATLLQYDVSPLPELLAFRFPGLRMFL
ncbi:hypothetical protein V6N13_084669 [Hibiscus sabdariffa]